VFKDPAHTAQTPYELLGLPLEPSRDAVYKALPAFMRDRRNLPKLGQAREAVQKLQSVLARAAIDIWMYQVGAPEEAAGAVMPEPPPIDTFLAVKAIGPAALYCDLDAPDPSARFRGIVPLTIRLSDVPSLDGLDGVDLAPAFDR
jgi:hypothetical protein